MYRHLTKLLLAETVAVALLALCFVSILTPAWAGKPVKPSPNPINCSAADDPFAKWNGSEWLCDPGNGEKGDTGATGPKGDTGDPGPAPDLTEIKKQIDDLILQLSEKIIFVSSATYTGNLGGVGGADDKCNVLAAAASLPGTYKAWLASTIDNDPESTFVRSLRPYILTDGTRVAHDWDDLTSGSILHAINLDETATLTTDPKYAWTNVDWHGEFDEPVWRDCLGWWSGVEPYFGNFGSALSSTGGASWTQVGYGPCTEDKRLYCVQQ